jgi:hypothetical protein
MCVNCGLNLPRFDSQSFGNQEEEDPLKTIAVGRQEFEKVVPSEQKRSDPHSSKETKDTASNSKFYWILGGVGGLVLIGGFFLLVLGIGTFLYLNSGSDERPVAREDVNRGDDTPSEDTSPREDEDSTSANPRTEMGRTILKMINDQYKSFGNFKLKAIEVKDLQTFDEADETIIGSYTEESESDQIIHSYSYYASWDTARKDATDQFREFKKLDSRANLKDRGNSLMGVFTVAERQYYMECAKAGQMGLCQLVSSDSPQQLRRYIDVRYK